MTRRTWRAIPLAALATMAMAAVALAAAIPIYSNDMATVGARSQLVKLGKGRCARSAQAETLKVVLGKATRECTFRTPVIGANLDVKATARLLNGTPDDLRKRVFVAVGIRVGSNGRYQLAVFPGKGSFQLRRDAPPDGTETLLAKGKNPAVKGLNQPNKLRLQGFGDSSGGVHLVAFVNGKNVGTASEGTDAAAKLSGRFSTITAGSAKSAKGASASFDDITVSVPDPF